MAHTEDCDGWFTTHRGTVRVTRSPLSTRAMFQAECDYCSWTGGLFGPDAATVANREARTHSAEVRCTGGCVSLRTLELPARGIAMSPFTRNAVSGTLTAKAVR